MTNKSAVIKMWKSGMTSGEIAAALRISRNQVMGVVFRAQQRGELSKKTQAQLAVIKSSAAMKRPTKKKPTLNQVMVANEEKRPEPKPQEEVRPVVQPPKAAKYSGKSKTLLELSAFECRWIHDDKKFCAKPTVSESTSWCAEHYPIVYSTTSRNVHKSEKYKNHILTIAKKYDQIKT